MLKYNDKEGIVIKKRRIIYLVIALAAIGIGAWLLNDASYQDTPEPDNSVVKDNFKKPEAVNPALDEEIPDTKPEETNNRENFELKDENEYVQLRLSVTSSDGKQEEVEEYLKENLDVDVVEDNLGNTVLASPREMYDSALSTIIDCPHTENVLYKNEDYYPVACEIYDKSSENGKISDDAAEYIENIEEMCREIIIVIN